MSLKIITAGKSDTQVIRDIALKTWEDTYLPIVGREQVDHCLELWYTVEALQSQMDNGDEFLLLFYEDKAAGFLSYNLKSPGRFRIPKLYVDPDIHGKGLGKALLEEVFKRAKEKGGNVMELNVNRYNKARGFYEKYGFKVVDEVDIPFGKYWLNDYVMEKEIR